MIDKKAFFHDGLLYHVSPRNQAIPLIEDRQIAYDTETVIISDTDVYDPANPKTISDLHIPRFDPLRNITVLDLSYIMKMRCASLENPNVLPAFVEKTISLMEASPIMWRRRDILRVFCNYHANGLFEAGDRAERQYRIDRADFFAYSEDDQHEAEHLHLKYYFENKWYGLQEYETVKLMAPDLAPKTIKGYLSIRTRKTKRFLEIQESAENKGYTFDFRPNRHFCRKIGDFVLISHEYDYTNRYPVLKTIFCDRYARGECRGFNEFDLSCVYPSQK